MNISSINKAVGKGLDWVAESSFMTKRFDESRLDPAKFAASMLVTSIITKDMVGGYLYTTQSLNNKKIPEERRGFVAALDGVNCFLMVGGQLLIGKLIERGFTPKAFGKLYSGNVKDVDTKLETPVPDSEASHASVSKNNLIGVVKETFSDKDDKHVSRKVRNIRAALKEKGIDVDKIRKMGEKDVKEYVDSISKALIKQVGPGSAKFKAIETGLAIFIGAIATTALTKRTLVPLVATPIAGTVKEKFMDKKTNKQNPTAETSKLTPGEEMELKSATVIAPWNQNKVEGDSFHKIIK